MFVFTVYQIPKNTLKYPILFLQMHGIILLKNMIFFKHNHNFTLVIED